MSATWNYILTALVSGAVTGFGSCLTQAGTTDWKHCGLMAAIGAVVGTGNLFRKSPNGP